MYKVVEENSLDHLKSNIDTKIIYKNNYVNCLGNNHLIKSESLNAKRPQFLLFAVSIFSLVAGSSTKTPSVKSLFLEKKRLTLEAVTNPKYGVTSSKPLPRSPGN